MKSYLLTHGILACEVMARAGKPDRFWKEILVGGEGGWDDSVTFKVLVYGMDKS